MKFERVGKKIAWGALFLVLLIFFARSKIPDDRVGTLALKEVSKLTFGDTRLELSAEQTHISLLLMRVRFKNLSIRVIQQGSNPKTIRLDEIHVSPAILDLLKGRTGGSIKLIQKNRTVLRSLFWVSRQGFYSIETEFDQADLGDSGLSLTQTFANFSSSASVTGVAKLEGSGTVASALGRVSLYFGNTKLEGLKLGDKPIPSIRFSGAEFQLTLDKGKLKAEQVRLGKMENAADDLRGLISGELLLDPNIVQSMLNLDVTLRVSKEITDSLGFIADVALGKPNADGIYQFKLSGSLGQPQRVAQ
ncbi:MAG: type II secretion system protein GspN [Bdellovibrionales bacterium]|nr:type II secretion system protein GspN [Bdellovibrionales bacterium]